MKCYEKIGKPRRDNIEVATDVSPDDFEGLFVHIAESIEAKFNFQYEIKNKKEAEKVRIMKEIQERL
jgi:hypothetical protein